MFFLLKIKKNYIYKTVEITSAVNFIVIWTPIDKLIILQNLGMYACKHVNM